MSHTSHEQNSKELVLPGERLGVIEEFTPDIGTYVKDGVIFSKVVGHKLIDMVHKRVSVQALMLGTRVPKTGSIVMAQVSNVQNQNAGMRIFKADRKKLSGVFTGILHVADVQMRFVDSMFDVCKAGDVVRAKVISEKNRTLHLSTKDKDLGVVYAFCGNCGYMLEPKRQGMLCPRCGRVERRKISVDYGKEET